MTEETSIQIENDIVDVFSRWLPFVELKDIQITSRDEVNQLVINIVFNIKRAPNSLESVQVTFDGVGNQATTATDGVY